MKVDGFSQNNLLGLSPKEISLHIDYIDSLDNFYIIKGSSNGEIYSIISHTNPNVCDGVPIQKGDVYLFTLHPFFLNNEYQHESSYPLCGCIFYNDENHGKICYTDELCGLCYCISHNIACKEKANESCFIEMAISHLWIREQKIIKKSAYRKITSYKSFRDTLLHLGQPFLMNSSTITIHSTPSSKECFMVSSRKKHGHSIRYNNLREIDFSQNPMFCLTLFEWKTYSYVVFYNGVTSEYGWILKKDLIKNRFSIKNHPPMPPTNPSTLNPNPSLAALPYNPALSLWLSVDPLSDKYPGVSPYAYCGNNPVQLVDPDGREVEYSSFGDRIIVGIERIFNKDFRAIFNELKKSEEIYVFNNNSNGINEFFTDGNKLFINYSTSSFTNENGKTCNPKEISGDIFSLLKHETFHALQFEHGEIAFSKNGNGEWKSVYYDIYDELAAHDFQYSGSCLKSGTQQKEWNGKYTNEEKIEYLKGIYPTVATDVSHTTYPEKIHNDKQYLMPHVAKNQYGKSRIELFPVIDWKPNTRVAYVYAIKNDTIFSYALFLSYPKDGTGKPIIDSVRTIDTNLHLWRKYWYRTYEDNGEVCFRITTWSKKRSQKQFPDYWNKCYFGDFEVVRRDVIFCNSKMQIIKREISFGTMAFLRNHNTSPKKLRKKLRIMLSKCTSDSKSTPY